MKTFVELRDGAFERGVGTLNHGRLLGPAKGHVYSLQRRFAVAHAFFREIRRSLVVVREEEESYGLRRPSLGRLGQGEEIAERFRHLLFVYLYETVMKPVLRKRFSCCGFRLGDFVFVMRKDEVFSSSMYLEIRSQVFHAHDRTFYVPAGSTFSPRAAPRRLAGFGFLPESEIERVILLLVHVYSHALKHVVERSSRKGSVIAEFPDEKKDVSAGAVGKSLFHYLLYHGDYLFEMVRHSGLYIRGLDSYRGHVVSVFLYVFFRNLLARNAFLYGAVYYLVVYVGEVSREKHVVSRMPQVSLYNIEAYGRAGVSQMGGVVHCGTADVHPHPVSLEGNQGLFFPGKGIVDFYRRRFFHFSEKKCEDRLGRPETF